jgi:hypothetical protein
VAAVIARPTLRPPRERRLADEQKAFQSNESADGIGETARCLRWIDMD